VKKKVLHFFLSIVVACATLVGGRALTRRTVIGGCALLGHARRASGLTLDMSDLDSHIFYADSVTTPTAVTLQTSLIRRMQLAQQAADAYGSRPLPIHLHIQSPGGSVPPALLLYDIIVNSSVPVHTHVEGLCASAATLVAVAGQHRTITRNSYMLLHQPSITLHDAYKYTELRDQARNMQSIVHSILQVYAERTTLSNDKLTELLLQDSLLDAQTCLTYGLVDEIV
jgi:ATP-dependent protease ClpP protease subunit